MPSEPKILESDDAGGSRRIVDAAASATTDCEHGLEGSTLAYEELGWLLPLFGLKGF
jgi:hypothetical protein